MFIIRLELWNNCGQRWCNQLWQENPTDKYASQWSFEPKARSFTGKHICQLDLQGTVDYRSLSAGDETLDILHGWKEIRRSAEDWIICAGQLNREITANTVEWIKTTSPDSWHLPPGECRLHWRGPGPEDQGGYCIRTYHICTKSRSMCQGCSTNSFVAHLLING